ncbi:hypothetical protein F5X99DRAFT_253031 [Biscogniauxia marginata]|nr:hypothetical protein F5X99DRAFT_253031 [Biscogniauxia marginata]
MRYYYTHTRTSTWSSVVLFYATLERESKTIHGNITLELYPIPGRTSSSPNLAKKHANRFNKSSMPLHPSFRSLLRCAQTSLTRQLRVFFTQGCNLLAGPVVCGMFLCLSRNIWARMTRGRAKKKLFRALNASGIGDVQPKIMTRLCGQIFNSLLSNRGPASRSRIYPLVPKPCRLWTMTGRLAGLTRCSHDSKKALINQEREFRGA